MTPTTTGSVQKPAIVVAGEDGTVVSQNAPARKLMANGRGRLCWEVVGKLPKADGFPCARGCVRELIRKGIESTQQTRVTLGGEHHRLTCIPINDHAVCILNAGANSPREPWQFLTNREQQVLQLLADGETSSSMARSLGVGESTVRTHVERMRDKLGVNTRAGLVALGFRLGFLE